MEESDVIVYAQLVLFSDKGRSIMDKAATSKNIQELAPSEAAKSKAFLFLKNAGFIVGTNGPTLSVTGKKSLFEKVFNFLIEVKTVNHVNYTIPKSSPVIPAKLKPIVKDILFSEPMEYFG